MKHFQVSMGVAFQGTPDLDLAKTLMERMVFEAQALLAANGAVALIHDVKEDE